MSRLNCPRLWKTRQNARALRSRGGSTTLNLWSDFTTKVGWATPGIKENRCLGKTSTTSSSSCLAATETTTSSSILIQPASLNITPGGTRESSSFAWATGSGSTGERTGPILKTGWVLSSPPPEARLGKKRIRWSDASSAQTRTTPVTRPCILWEKCPQAPALLFTRKISCEPINEKKISLSHTLSLSRYQTLFLILLLKVVLLTCFVR